MFLKVLLCILICFSVQLSAISDQHSAISVQIAEATDGALQTQQEKTRSKKKSKEKAESRKKTYEKSKSKGKRTTDSNSYGTDTQTAEALKEVENLMANSQLNVQQELGALMQSKILELENSDNDTIFRKCRVLSKPLTLTDIGLGLQREYSAMEKHAFGGSSNGYDAVKGQYLDKAAKSYANIGDIADEKKLKEYIKCVNDYGAIIGQAYLYLQKDVAGLSKKMKIKNNYNNGYPPVPHLEVKDKDNIKTGNVIEIRDIGYDDLVKLSDDALLKAAADMNLKAIPSLFIRRIYNTIESNEKCKFFGEITRFQCGQAFITIAEKPQLMAGGIKIFGEKFYDFTATFAVSSAWSLSTAIEKLASTSKYQKTMHDVSKYAEDMERSGKSRESVVAMKQAVEDALAGKTTSKLGDASK